MVRKIDRDHARFREIVRGRIKQDLKKFVSSGELIGRQGGKYVSIPIPQINLPRFRFGPLPVEVSVRIRNLTRAVVDIADPRLDFSHLGLDLLRLFILIVPEFLHFMLQMAESLFQLTALMHQLALLDFAFVMTVLIQIQMAMPRAELGLNVANPLVDLA